MSNPFGGDIFDPIDDPFIGQLDPFRETLAPFRNPIITNPAPPYSYLEMYERRMDDLIIPQRNLPQDDPLCRQMSELELEIESSLLTKLTSSAPFVLPNPLIPVPYEDSVIKRPVKNFQLEGPPLPEENTWRGFREPEPPLFNKLRASRAGVRSSSDRSEGETYCWRDFQFVDKESCPACDQWDSLLELCGYRDTEESDSERE